ncbi:hypothetical protein JCM13664_15990 [Methylothermus subterraneus]
MRGKSVLRITYVAARRLAVALIGGTLVLLGVVMIVFPGPAMLVIPLGLVVLGLEFAWARHWLGRLQEEANNQWDKLRKIGNRHLDKIRQLKTGKGG